MTSIDQRIAPDQPSDPALFAPPTFDENKVLRAHLSSGWHKQSVVYPVMSEPYRETGGLLDDLHDAHQAAMAAYWAGTRAKAKLAEPEPEAGA